MEKSMKQIIIMAFLFVIISFLGVSLISAVKANLDTNENSSCSKDSDCKLTFSNCSCSNACVLKTDNNFSNCEKNCTIEESNTTISKCGCKGNKCSGENSISEKETKAR